MKVLEVGKMKDGTKIQIEDWSEDLYFINKASTLAAYPKSKIDMEGEFAPKRNRVFRVAFNFEGEMEAREAFRKLVRGAKSLLDFTEYINDPKKTQCL